MITNSSSTLFVFIDESGNFDFSPKGTKYWVLTAVTTRVPMKGREELIRLRYELLARGINQEAFHATEDRQEVRDRVYQILRQLDDYFVHSVFVQKNKANPALYERGGKGKTKHRGEDLYSVVAKALLKYVFLRYGDSSSFEEVVVVLGALFTRAKQDVINQVLKSQLKEHIQKPFHIYFHDGRADINAQIADYCCWAVYRKLEDGEHRPLDSIKPRVAAPPFDIFKSGTTEYYKYPKS